MFAKAQGTLRSMGGVQDKVPFSVVQPRLPGVRTQTWAQQLAFQAASDAGEGSEEAGILGVPKRATFTRNLADAREPGVIPGEEGGGQMDNAFLKEGNGVKWAALQFSVLFLIEHWLLFAEVSHSLRHTVGVQQTCVG